MKIRSSLIVPCLAWLLWAGAANAALPTADEIVSKCLASYDAARSYRATVSIEFFDRGKRASTRIRIAAENKSKLNYMFALRSHPVL